MAAMSIYGKNTFKIFFSRTAKGIWTKFGMKHVGTMMIIFYILDNIIQYNLNSSNLDGSFTLDDSNSFFSPYKILPIAQENKYLGIFSYFIMELYVVCTH